ncbi:hypothetical protein DWZ40_16090 [Clostridium sp. AF32-12BH]|nr:hypothetical protein DWZ40_16090 [Clostridium sp. AF32-12BH]
MKLFCLNDERKSSTQSFEYPQWNENKNTEKTNMRTASFGCGSGNCSADLCSQIDGMCHGKAFREKIAVLQKRGVYESV